MKAFLTNNKREQKLTGSQAFAQPKPKFFRRMLEKVQENAKPIFTFAITIPVFVAMVNKAISQNTIAYNDGKAIKSNITNTTNAPAPLITGDGPKLGDVYTVNLGSAPPRNVESVSLQGNKLLIGFNFDNEKQEITLPLDSDLVAISATDKRVLSSSTTGNDRYTFITLGFKSGLINVTFDMEMIKKAQDGTIKGIAIARTKIEDYSYSQNKNGFLVIATAKEMNIVDIVGKNQLHMSTYDKIFNAEGLVLTDPKITTIGESKFEITAPELEKEGLKMVINVNGKFNVELVDIPKLGQAN